MKAIRYKFETAPLTAEEAVLRRAAELQHLRDRMRAIQCEYMELLSRPLPTHAVNQIELRPGDPGYEDAPAELSVIDYKGDFTFEKP